MTDAAILPAAGVFIDNRWHAPAAGQTIDVVAPATGAVFARIAAGDAADVDRAVQAARAALAGEWGKLSATERGRLLSKLAARIGAEAEALAQTEARDTGKPLTQARADMTATARYFEYYGGAADKVHGDTIPFLPGYFVTTERVPHGVTGHIIPWNYPAQMFARTVGPALAMGNACVVKPAEDACLTPLRIAELAAEVGLPAGALNVVPGTGEDAGDALAHHPGIDFISFTGSPEVGTLIQTAAAKHHIGVTMELGGKSPHVVFGDADIAEAAKTIALTMVQNAGQTCSAGSRALIEASVFDAVSAALATEFAKLTAGTPEMDHQLGPVINAAQRARIEGFFARAAEAGVPILAEGKVADGVPHDGYFIAPRLYGPVPRDHELARQEVFGPVLAVLSFEDEADAVRLANDTDYGLMAAVWTRDGNRALRVARQIRAGQVYINAFGAGGGVELPFGGMKKSGHGREKGFAALHDASTLRTTIVKHG